VDTASRGSLLGPAALRRTGFEVLPAGPTRDGEVCRHGFEGLPAGPGAWSYAGPRMVRLAAHEMGSAAQGRGAMPAQDGELCWPREMIRLSRGGSRTPKVTSDHRGSVA
jgi:hypothetical protein